MQYFIPAAVIIYGFIIGSFLAMLVYRLPSHISLFKQKRSFCPNCSHKIKWYENIPFFSYIFLKGKCSNCHKKISILYPIIELTTALTTFVLYVKIGISSHFFIILFFCYYLITLFFMQVFRIISTRKKDDEN